MRSGLLALRAAGAATVLAPVLVLAPAAGLAHAGEEEPGGHHKVTALVLPAIAAPGADVEVRVTGCKRDHGHAKSKAFLTAAPLSAQDGKGAPLRGATAIKPQISPGTYDVAVHCDGRVHHAAGTVHVMLPASATPTAPVRAGGGGAAALAADPAQAPSVADAVTGADAGEGGPGTPHTVIGLVLAGAAAVAVAFRSARLRRRRRTGVGTGPGAD
ncbi:hypothetical protein AB0A69_19305 [Streptomyces sp. NPDC045431]|uniref:hypothetical protein n=1 Tax=Streptomyces sp. NPDC045431 TaxID=3155613 RepID=UPI0033CF4473